MVFRKEWYEEIKELAGKRPIAIGECSAMPTLTDYEKQPDYAWFMLWSDLGTKDNSREKLIEVFNSEKCLTVDKILKMRGF